MLQDISLLLNATWETILMVFLSGGFGFLCGIPLGTLTFITGKNQLIPSPLTHYLLNGFINIGRSIPFIILMVLIIPITRFITGSSIGTAAAIVPLTLSAVPFIARLTESAIGEVPSGLTEAAQAMGANKRQIVTKILLPEALPTLIHGITLTLVTLVGYTAMAGTLGGGGLGSVAINHGYQRFNTTIMIITVTILIILVHLIQWAGNKIHERYSH